MMVAGTASAITNAVFRATGLRIRPPAHDRRVAPVTGNAPQLAVPPQHRSGTPAGMLSGGEIVRFADHDGEQVSDSG